MLALIQRVSRARVAVGGRTHAETGAGLLAFIGIERRDTEALAAKLLERILAYRVFNDEDGRMNLSLEDTGGELMLVSQFTLAASTDKGLRPGFSAAMEPAAARALYARLVELARRRRGGVASGEFGADMRVSLENDGPVTFLLKAR